MTVDSTGSAEGSFFTWEIDKDLSSIDAVSQKTQLIWAQIYDTTRNSLSKIIHVSRSSIGAVIRDHFFFPLKSPFFLNMHYVKEQLKIERTYSSNFWDLSKPTDPNFKDQAQIRAQFDPPVDRVFSIPLKNGGKAKITCRIMETKNKGDSFYNFIQVPGIHATIDNNAGATIPYLSAYLTAHKDRESLPPGRFIILSANNLDYKPATIDDGGLALLETLKILNAEFGEIDQLVAHSLGNVFSASALKQLDDPKFIPKHICLDRGPTSIKEVSKKYFFGLGRMLYFLAEFGRWAPDIEKDIVAFYEKWKGRFSLTITGVEHDHYFAGAANLCLGEQIQKIEGAEILIFNPPLQIIHEHGHHNWGPNNFNRAYQTTASNFIGESENLCDAIIRHSLPLLTKIQ